MKNIYFILLIIITALIGVKALFHSGFYTSHDGRHQIIRLMHFHQGLVDGQLPVRWAGTALSGYGYPLFIFTYRLPFWLAENWYLLSKNLGDSIKFVFIISFISSGLTMFWFATKLWSSKLAGFLSAILYLWVPYQFLNIFVRAALGEAVTFMFIPLFYLSVLELNRTKRNNFWWILIGILSLAGIILSHSMTLVLWLIPFGIWVVFNFYLSKYKKRYIFSIMVLAFISLLLTLYYWLPALIEKKYTVFNSVLGNYYQNHFVTLKQLLYSKWGYGFDFYGVKDDMMSFQVGVSQWLVIGFTFIVLGFNFYKKRLFLFKEKMTFIIYFICIFFLAIYFMIDKAGWFYELVKKIMVIDLPWRFLGVAVFSASILGGGIVSLMRSLWFKLIIMTILIAIAFYSNRNHLKVNQYTNYPDSEYWQDQETSNERDDYAPKWFVKPLQDREIQLVNLEGESKNTLLKRTSNNFIFRSEVESGMAEISARIAYYPGWRTFIDNQEGETINKDGKITVVLEKGTHQVALKFKETPLRLIANLFSLLTLLFIISCFFVYARTKK